MPPVVQYLQSSCGHLATVQLDGNFVMYDKNGQAYYSSATSGQGVTPSRLILQGTGKLALIDAAGKCVQLNACHGAIRMRNVAF